MDVEAELTAERRRSQHTGHAERIETFNRQFNSVFFV